MLRHFSGVPMLMNSLYMRFIRFPLARKSFIWCCFPQAYPGLPIRRRGAWSLGWGRCRSDQEDATFGSKTYHSNPIVGSPMLAFWAGGWEAAFQRAP